MLGRGTYNCIGKMCFVFQNSCGEPIVSFESQRLTIGFQVLYWKKNSYTVLKVTISTKAHVYRPPTACPLRPMNR
jgi:hypothetical protein